MQEHPLVSIVIPVYNGANYMREAIDSALAQTYPNVEILVVNDGSTDDTREIALSYGDRIRYFEKDNGGVSTALNTAIANMHGDYFSWLSHDDVYYPDKIQAEIDVLRTSGNMNQGVHSAWETITMPSGKIAHYNDVPMYSLLNRKYFTVGAFITALGLVNGCSLLIPKEYFDEFGEFDTSLRGVQDYVKWFQMFRGKRVLYVDRVLVRSRVHGEQVTYRYGRMGDEEKRLYQWIANSLQSSDLYGSELSEYQFFGAMITRLQRDNFFSASKRVMERLLEMDESNDSNMIRSEFAARLYGLGDGTVYVYCAGAWGQALVTALYLRGVTVAGISDSHVEYLHENSFGIPFVRPSDVPKTALVIVAKYGSIEVMKKLRDLGYENVICYDVLMNRLLEVPVKKALVKGLFV